MNSSRRQWQLEPQWWRKPLRISQTNLQARDTPRYRPEVFMRQLAEMDSNVTIANAGDTYAWYPTQVPDHKVNPFLEGRDFVRECVDAAHANGMHFVARVPLYFANGIGRLAWRYRLPDHARLIANAVRAVAPHPFPAELVGAPYGVQLSLFRRQTPARLLCHLVNTCGAGTVRHDLLPLHDLRLRLPAGARRARALALGQDLVVESGAASLPVLRTWEVIAAELGDG